MKVSELSWYSENGYDGWLVGFKMHLIWNRVSDKMLESDLEIHKCGSNYFDMKDLELDWIKFSIYREIFYVK